MRCAPDEIIDAPAGPSYETWAQRSECTRRIWRRVPSTGPARAMVSAWWAFLRLVHLAEAPY
jgi:hypothetical protein